jgi:hypothetical protein
MSDRARARRARASRIRRAAHRADRARSPARAESRASRGERKRGGGGLELRTSCEYLGAGLRGTCAFSARAASATSGPLAHVSLESGESFDSFDGERGPRSRRSVGRAGRFGRVGFMRWPDSAAGSLARGGNSCFMAPASHAVHIDSEHENKRLAA